jgi:hypothetical protein
MIGLHTD